MYTPHCSSTACGRDIFRGTWDLKSATWSLDHKDQHTWIWKWLTDGLGRYRASNISTLWILLLRPILVTLPFNCSAPFNYNSMRLETKKDFSHMSVFSKSQLSSPNRLRDIRAWSYYVALKIWSTRLIHSNFKPSYLRDGWGQRVEIWKTHSYDWNLFSFAVLLSCDHVGLSN